MDTLELTNRITSTNIDVVRNEIQKKISPHPYFANGKIVSNVITDMDHHPYTRWYRGVYYYPDPIVMEREAGYRNIRNDCYTVQTPKIKDPVPKHCWQPPVSTVFPCIPESADYDNAERVYKTVNHNCNVQFR